MSVDVAFDRVGEATGPEQISRLFARMQRDRFTRGLRPGGGRVLQVINTGNASSREIPEEMTGIDLIAVLPADPLERISTAATLTMLRNLVWAQVYGRRMHDRDLDRHLRYDDRAVRCSWKDLSLRMFDGLITEPSAVTVMPAYRRDSQIVVPTAGSWVELPAQQVTDPVERSRRAWDHFTDISRMIRAWSRCRETALTSIAVDVLTLAFMPRPQRWRTLTRAEALARFFRTAAEQLDVIRVPGSGAELDTGLDYPALRRSLAESAELARTAADAATDGDRVEAENIWNHLLGNDFGPGWMISTLCWVWQDRSTSTAVGAGWPDSDSHPQKQQVCSVSS